MHARLQAVEEVVGEDVPGAPEAQQAQHVPPQALLCHAAVHAAVRLLLRQQYVSSLGSTTLRHAGASFDACRCAAAGSAVPCSCPRCGTSPI
jgi:hypothetical protein